MLRRSTTRLAEDLRPPNSIKLSVRAREVISEGRNKLFFSAASGWEIAIEADLGRLEIPGDLQRFVADQLFPSRGEVDRTRL